MNHTTSLQANASNTTTVSAPPNALREFWGYFSQNRGAVIGLVVVCMIVLAALLADVIAPHSPIEQFREATLTPPVWQTGGTAKFLLGTDPVGRDMLSRLIHGTRLSLVIGLVSVSLSLALGVVLGLLAGYFRGAAEVAIMRLMDIMV